MSETREEFRQRMAQLHDDTYARSMDQQRPAADTNELIWGAQEEALCDAAEAVAALVLRDLIASHEGCRCLDCLVEETWVQNFAAERGIDLENQT